MNPREEKLITRALLADQAKIDVYLKQKRWAELVALVRFARREVPVELAQTDPALYRQLREQITRFFLRGGRRVVPSQAQGVGSRLNRFTAGASNRR